MRASGMQKILVLVVGIWFVACEAPPLVEKPPVSPETISTSTTHRSTPGVRDEAVSPQIAAWLRENAVPFRTTRPDTDFADLMPLKAMIGEARIVALGEATHGTHEFFQMKYRLIRFLVEEMDFNIVAFEANWPEANLINDYVQSGHGNAANSLAGLQYWTWNTQEVLDLIEWMRNYNQQHGNAPPISFYGFDMQSAKLATDNVITYLETVDSAAMKSAQVKFACFRPYQDYTWQQPLYAQQTTETKMACRRDLQAVYDNLAAHQSAYEALSSPEAFVLTLQNARIILQNEKMAATSEDGNFMAVARFDARDQAMAENVTWLLEQAGPDAKIILWAHNAHVQTVAWNFQDVRYTPMGNYLRQRYGNELVVFGFSFYTGSFNAFDYDASTGNYHGLKAHPAGQLPPNNYEQYLHSAGLSHFFLDLRQITPLASANDWLFESHWFRFVGAVYDSRGKAEDSAYVVKLPEAFDVLIYIDETSPSILLQ
jgi:erythromycin esterase